MTEKRTSSVKKHILRQKIVIYERKNLITKLLDATTGDKVVFEQRLEFTSLLEARGDVFGIVKHFKIIDLKHNGSDFVYHLST
jgi:hypothetical protein